MKKCLDFLSLIRHPSLAMQTTLPQGKKINFCLYARKSSERDELQALSIDSQIKEILAVADRDKLKVIDIRKESHSAKDSGERPVFKAMIDDVKQDKIQGILTWAPDRLSRNAGDLGVLVDLMDQNYLLEIRTYNQVFTNTPNDKFLLMILGSQAKLENDNKAINVKRGLKVKCEMGFRPGMTPLGYINDLKAQKGEKKIYLDPKRAPIIKEMFERSTNGESGRKVLNWLNSTGFTTKSGKNIMLSTIYKILRTSYYCGKFEYPEGSGNWYKVAHESIISEDLFEQVQKKLTVAPKAKPGTKEFNFTRIIKCGNCESGVTAEEKFKTLRNKTRRRYVYYHCTGGKDRNCKESYIREEELIEQLEKLLDKLDLSKLSVKQKLQGEIERYERFTKDILGQKISNQNHNQVDLKNYAKYIIKNGNREEKREILSCLKTTIYLKNRQIYLKT